MNLFGILFKFPAIYFLQTYPTEIESKISHEMILSKEIPLIKKCI